MAAGSSRSRRMTLAFSHVRSTISALTSPPRASAPPGAEIPSTPGGPDVRAKIIPSCVAGASGARDGDRLRALIAGVATLKIGLNHRQGRGLAAIKSEDPHDADGEIDEEQVGEILHGRIRDRINAAHGWNRQQHQGRSAAGDVPPFQLAEPLQIGWSGDGD